KPLTVPAMDVSKTRLADVDCPFQHGCEHRLKIAWRATDDLQDFRSGGLLVQRLGQLLRALLFRLAQTRVLDCDYRLIGESFNQLYLLLRERPNLGSVQEKNANRDPLSQKRHAEDRAKIADTCNFTLLVFRIGKNIRNLNGFALEQDSAGYTAAPRR